MVSQYRIVDSHKAVVIDIEPVEVAVETQRYGASLTARQRLNSLKRGKISVQTTNHVEYFGTLLQACGYCLKGCYRVLKPGGVVRIAVPDFVAVVALYAQEGLQDGLSGLVGLVCGGQRNQYDFHKIIFDEAFLTYLLEKIGFKDVRRWDWRATEHAHIDDFSQSYIPHMDKQNGRLMSLNLEAAK